jgi:DNA-binding transcriptional MerR regulator
VSTQTEDGSFRIGEVAERVGVSPRTIRYYEEFGLLGAAAERTKGSRRRYGEAAIVRLEELVRLRKLLGLSLDELVMLVEAEEARSALNDPWEDSATDAERACIVDTAIALFERRLELVHARQRALGEFSDELAKKLRSLRERKADLERGVRA